MTAPCRDVVIIGGGSAGCAIAHRLSEDPSRTVTVLEAGRRDAWWDVLIHMPAALSLPIGNRLYDWRYYSEPEPFMNGRRVYHARGKILGGSSSINGMVFQRGNPADFDEWAQRPGLENWSHADCLPYFKRMESCATGQDEYRGRDGPLALERGRAEGPLFRAFFEAAEQAGFGRSDDTNGRSQEGFSPFDRNILNGRRWSAVRAYLDPARKRRNLEIHCRAWVTRILFEGRRAVGVEYVQRGRMRRILSDEIICSGGAINSPQLLQLSGIGPAPVLEALGIRVHHDLPGVGENLQDHLEVYVQHACKKPVSLTPNILWRWRPWIGAQWLAGAGPGMSNHFEAGGFVRSGDDQPYPNLMIHFLPMAVRYDGTRPTRGHGYQLHIGPMKSDARGHLRLRSSDPRDPPRMQFNYLSTGQDRREWVQAIECARHILAQDAFQEFDGGELSPGDPVQTADQVLDWVARDAETALHPSCTCRMGADPMAVVDPTSMRVHGLEGLRVVDASVMPTIPNGNIYAPVMMIAEKAADMILGRPALPRAAPESAPPLGAP
jgi:choline dehydrogenase